MPEINFLKDQLKGGGLLSGKTGVWSLYAAVAIIVLEVLLFAGFNVYERSLKNKVNSVKQQAQALEFEVSQIEDERLEAVSFQERLFNLKTLLDNQVVWTPLFQNLEENTLNTIFYRTLQVSEFERKLNLSGVAPSYTDVAKLIRGLEEAPGVTRVDLISSGLTEAATGGVVFSLEISFSGDILETN